MGEPSYFASGSSFGTILVLSLFAFLIMMLPFACLAVALYQLFSLPMRRQERVAFLLDLLETSEEQGKTFADSILATALGGDGNFGARFRALADRLARGQRLDKALKELPSLLPPQILAMLQVGAELGNVNKVLPVCRQWLADGHSRMMGFSNYLLPLTLYLTPVSLVIVPFLAVVILPKFKEIFLEMLGDTPLPGLTLFVFGHQGVLMLLQLAVAFSLCFAVFIYSAGPRLTIGFEGIYDRLCHLIPWRRRRLQRDFSAMLALLLDAEVPETRAVSLAAQSTASQTIMRRAKEAVRDLESGLPLLAALRRMDDTGEFQWRLRHATHVHQRFSEALAGWHESLDAKAYQQEQIAAQLITTGMVVMNGIAVGLIVSGLFMVLTVTVQRVALW